MGGGETRRVDFKVVEKLPTQGKACGLGAMFCPTTGIRPALLPHPAVILVLVEPSQSFHQKWLFTKSQVLVKAYTFFWRVCRHFSIMHKRKPVADKFIMRLSQADTQRLESVCYDGLQACY